MRRVLKAETAWLSAITGRRSASSASAPSSASCARTGHWRNGRPARMPVRHIANTALSRKAYSYALIIVGTLQSLGNTYDHACNSLRRIHGGVASTCVGPSFSTTASRFYRSGR